MSEFEIIKILTDSGISFVAVGGLGFLLYKVNKTLCEVVKSDQESRERNTIALTKLESSIDEFNRVNGQNQIACNLIRESMAEEVTRLSKLKGG